MEIWNGQLYFGQDKITTSPVIEALDTATTGTLQTSATGTTVNPLPGVPTSGSISSTAASLYAGSASSAKTTSFFFAKVGGTADFTINGADSGYNTLYLADESTTTTGANPGITKYSWNATNSTWTYNGTIGGASDSFEGLIGSVSGTTVSLYSTVVNPVTGATTGIVSIVDNSGFNTTITNNGSTTPTVLGNTAIPTADAGEALRGLAFAPDDGAQPIGGLGGTTNYSLGGGATVVGGSITFSDQSSFNGGSLVVSGGATGDSLTVTSVGTGAGQIGVSGTTVTYGGKTIGTISGGTGTTALTITFDNVVNTNGAGGAEYAVTGAAVQALMNQVSFSSTGASGNRTLTFTVNKNSPTNVAGAYSNLNTPATDTTSSTQTVNVQAVVATPPSINTPSNVVVGEGSSGVVTVPLSGIASNNGGGDTLTVSASSNNTALTGTIAVSYTSPNATGSLSFTPVTTSGGTATITVTVADTTDGISTPVTFTTTVAAPPTINAPAAQTAGEDTSHAISGLSLTDIYVGSSNVQLTLGVAQGSLTVNSGVPGGLTSGGISGNATGTVTLTGSVAAINTTLASSTGLVYLANSGYTGTDTLSLSASDLGNTGTGAQTASTTVAITVISAPTVSGTGLLAIGSTPLGYSAPITSAMLSASAPDNTASQLVYKLNSIPANGVLAKSGVALAVNGTFTQADINAGNITYAPSASGSDTDSFTYTLADTASDSTSGSFSITANVDQPTTASYGGNTYAPSFNGLPSTGTYTFTQSGPFDFVGSNSATPPQGVGATPGDPGLTGWSFAGSATPAKFAVGDGAGGTTTGAVYSWGSGSDTPGGGVDPSSDRSLGLIGTSSEAPTVGVTLVNNTGRTLTQLNIAYDGQVWHLGTSTSTQTLTFGYALGAASIVDPTATFNPDANLNYSITGTGTAGALDGNAAANMSLKTDSIAGVSWAPGQTLVLRWSIGGVAQAPGLAIDNFSFTAQSVPTVTVSDAGGPHTGNAYPATALVNGAASQDGVSPIITYYSGTTATGTPLSGAPSAVGTYTVIANFPGSANYLAASSSPVTFTIGLTATTTTVSDAGGVYTGSPYPATALVNGAASLEGVSPTVTYYSGNTATGTPLSSVPTTVGTYTAVANFAGSTDFGASSSNPVTFNITAATPTVTASDAGGTYNGSPFPASALVAGVVAGVDNIPAASLEGVTPTLAYYVGGSAAGMPSSTAPTTAGTYTVVASFAGSADYASAASAPVTFTIADATPMVTATDVGGTYNGSPYPAIAQVNGGTSLEGITPTLAYYIGGTPNGTPSATAPTTAGTYTVVANFAGSTDYAATASSPVTFTIAPATPSVTVSDTGGTYNGSAFAATGKVNGSASLEGVSLTFAYYSGSTTGGTLLGGAPSTAGTYTAVANFGGSTDYAAAASNPVTFNITLATPTVTVSDAGGIVTGNPFPATATIAGVVSGVDTTPAASLEGVSPTVAYYAGSSAIGTPLSSAPSAVGTYTVVASFVGSNDYGNAVSAPVTFSILNKPTPTLTVTDAGGTYNGSSYSATPLVNGGASLEGVTPTLAYYVGTAASGMPSTTAPSVVGTYTVVASFAGSTDYGPATSNPVTFTIAQATPTVAVTPPSSGTFTGSPFVATALVNGGASLEGVTPTVAYYFGSTATGTPLSGPPTTAGTYTVVATFAGSTDYAATTSTPVMFTISQVATSVTATDSGGTFNGSAFAATAQVNGVASLEGVSPTFEYYVGGTVAGMASSVAPSAIGTYTVVASFSGSADYAASVSSPVTFTITPVSAGITVGLPSGVAAIAGQTVNVPVSVTDNAYGMASADFAFDFDPSVLGITAGNITLSNALNTLGGWTLSDNVDSVDGIAYVNLFSTTPLAAGTPQLLNLAFSVLSTAPIGLSAISIDPSQSDLGDQYGNTLPLNIVNGSVQVSQVPTVTVSDAGGVYTTGAPFAATALVNGSTSLEGVSPTLAYYLGSTATGTPSSTAPSAIGTYTVVANFAGSADYQAASSAPVTFTIAPFEVTSFTANTTGFTIGLNDSPKLSVLNLYGGFGSQLGAADLTVLNGSTPVQGSLVWNAANDTATFVQTRGALAAGTYNVSLISGSSAWVDNFGNTLDSGTNYTNSFSVATPSTPILTLPDFARGPGQPVNVSDAPTGYGNANATFLPVAISTTAGVSSLSFELDYNASYLNISNVALAAGISGTLSVTNTTPGVLLVSVTNFNSSATATAVGGTNILNITASVPSAAISTYGASALLNLVNSQINGSSTPGSTSLEKVVYFGDTNADGKLTGADASLDARNSAHLDNGFTAYPLTDPRIIADVTGSTNITAGSASLIAQASVHIAEVDIPTIPSHGTITLAGVDPTVAIPTNIAGAAGQIVNVPVSITDNALGLASADFAFDYNPAVLSLSAANITLGKTLSSLGWTLVSNVDSAHGVAYVSIYSTTGLPAGTPQLLNLAFSVANNAPTGSTPISIDPTQSAANNAAGNAMVLSLKSGSVAITGSNYQAGIPGQSATGKLNAAAIDRLLSEISLAESEEAALADSLLARFRR